MPEKLDGKFYGEIRKVKDDSIVPDDEYIVFLAKDNAFAAIFPGYIAKCKELGCDEEQVTALERAHKRLQQWRTEHADRCKIPDAAGEKMLG